MGRKVVIRRTPMTTDYLGTTKPVSYAYDYSYAYSNSYTNSYTDYNSYNDAYLHKTNYMYNVQQKDYHYNYANVYGDDYNQNSDVYSYSVLSQDLRPYEGGLPASISVSLVICSLLATSRAISSLTKSKRT